jgi:hypothetical protein
MEEMGASGLGGRLDESRGVDVEYVDFGAWRNITLLYDGEAGRFSVGNARELIREKRARAAQPREKTDAHPDELESNAGEAKIAEIRDAVKEGDSQSQIRGDSPVFYGSPKENLYAFWKSHERNLECADALKNAFRRHFDGNSINTEAVIEDIKEFSSERISVVLANTMRTREEDGRFSPANRKWQESVTLPESSYMYYTAVDSHSTLVDHLVTTLRELRSPDRQTVGATDPDAAYWAHYRDIAATSSGDLDYSRIDAQIGVRMKATDHTPDQVRSAIEKNASTMRRDTMDAGEFDAKYKNRDWRGYAAETTENYVFGARGAIQYEKALSDRPRYMRIEGRNLQEEDRIRRESERQDKEQGRSR